MRPVSAWEGAKAGDIEEGKEDVPVSMRKFPGFFG
jgi:hypothetical protein